MSCRTKGSSACVHMPMSHVIQYNVFSCCVLHPSVVMRLAWEVYKSRVLCPQHSVLQLQTNLQNTRREKERGGTNEGEREKESIAKVGVRGMCLLILNTIFSVWEAGFLPFNHEYNFLLSCVCIFILLWHHIFPESSSKKKDDYIFKNSSSHFCFPVHLGDSSWSAHLCSCGYPWQQGCGCNQWQHQCRRCRSEARGSS